MKILNFISTLSGGGAERQLSYLAPELAGMGHDVHIAYSNEGPRKPELPGVALCRFKASSNYNPYLLWQAMRFIRRINPDIIHTWILQMDILGGIAARLCGVPWIFREPSSAMAYSLIWKYRLRVRVGSGARAIVANSPGGVEYWKSRLPDKHCYLVPNGLQIRGIDSISPALPPGLAQLEVPIVLYVGRLSSDISANKNLRVFLEALAGVRKKQKVEGILCGEGPQRSELEALTRDLGLEADIHFTGYLSPALVWALMKRASVFVSLSAFEGCPNAVMEAMACGCPLVLSDIPAHRALLGSDTALFVNPKNLYEITEAVLLALHDTDSAKVRVLIARQRAQEWSISEMARKYEKVYREII
jgi:glycosyltransferase involved in cell wall biosynthesis